MRFTHGAAILATVSIGTALAADASAQVTRIDLQVVEIPGV